MEQTYSDHYELFVYLGENSCVEVIRNPKPSFSQCIEFTLEVHATVFRSTNQDTDDTGDVQVVSPSDASSIPFVEQDEVDIVFDCIADCRCLPEVELVKDFDEEVRSLHLDNTQDIAGVQLPDRFQAVVSFGQFAPDLTRDDNLGKL